MSGREFKVIRRPIVTEKGTRLEAQSQVVFEVDGKATKHQIREAVEKLFQVKVEDVNTMRVRGKPIRRGLIKSRRPHWKKAIVTLREGDRIDFFEGM